MWDLAPSESLRNVHGRNGNTIAHYSEIYNVLSLLQKPLSRSSKLWRKVRAMALGRRFRGRMKH